MSLPNTVPTCAQDGSIRPARSIYEWLQQFVIEQCAVLLAVPQACLYKDGEDWELPCQLGNADGYRPPTMQSMKCAQWWYTTRERCPWAESFNEKFGPGRKVVKGKRGSGGENVFNQLAEKRRDAERAVRTARVALPKMHGEGHLLFSLIQPHLSPGSVLTP